MVFLSGPVYKYDLSLPVAKIYDIVEETRKRVRSHKDATVVAYGHLGDGNVHLNISAKEYSSSLRQCLEPFVYEYAAQHQGSISAEHGEFLKDTHVVGHPCNRNFICPTSHILHSSCLP